MLESQGTSVQPKEEGRKRKLESGVRILLTREREEKKRKKETLKKREKSCRDKRANQRQEMEIANWAEFACF